MFQSADDTKKSNIPVGKKARSEQDLQQAPAQQ